MLLTLLSGAALLVGVMILVQLMRAQREPPQLLSRLDGLDRGSERVERVAREELVRSRKESLTQGKELREELSGQLSTGQRALLERLDWLRDSVEERLESVRGTIETQLRNLADDNGERLEAMRVTVDEKLQGTLERRLGESFKQVSERLEQVQRGLGEMQALQAGVGDLRRVLSNVKTRGGWGEVQLGALLEELFTPSQLVKNYRPRPHGAEHVEFALRMPGQGSEAVYLPIDAKFPVEDYDRLRIADEAGDPAAVELAAKQLELRVRACAKDIADKYIVPPATTDFALLYLPTEGLYAEVLRRGDLAGELQRKQRVVVVGPTTLSALLSSLQLGFRTLAVEQRSSEVMQLLAAVKAEFDKFGDVLAKVKEKLGQAQSSIGAAETRTRVIARQLRDIEASPALQGQPGLEE
ncbi:MAG: DNA recombination protein RmuC [Polyangia bacterium]